MGVPGVRNVLGRGMGAYVCLCAYLGICPQVLSGMCMTGHAVSSVMCLLCADAKMFLFFM